MHLLDDGTLVLSPSDLTGFSACEHLTQLELSVAARRDRARRSATTRCSTSSRAAAASTRTKQLEPLPRRRQDRRRDRRTPTAPAPRSTTPRPQTLAAMRKRRRRHLPGHLLRRPAGAATPTSSSGSTRPSRPRRLVLRGRRRQARPPGEGRRPPPDVRVLRAARAPPGRRAARTSTSSPATASATPFKLTDYSAYYRALKARFEALVDAPARRPAPRTYPDPVDHCGICRWADVCTDRRRADDHLSLVAGMRRDQTRKLADVGIATTHRARRAAAPARTVDGIGRRERSSGSATRPSSRSQADGDRRRRSTSCSRPSRPTRLDPDDAVAASAGSAALPAPSPGDLFFDMEGDPYALDDERPRVPVRRHRARRRRRAALPRVLGARPRRGEAPRSRTFVDFVMAAPRRRTPTCTSTTTRPTSRRR